MPHRPAGPAPWTLRVDGHLDEHWSAWFSDLTLTHEDDGTTRLTGMVADQAAVHGLLVKIRDLGLTLVSAEVGEVLEVGKAADPGAPRDQTEYGSTDEGSP